MAAPQRGDARGSKLREVQQELDQLREDEAEVSIRSDFLRRQAEEISAANLRPAEDDALAQERDRVANAERIVMLADHAYQALYDGSDRQESVMDLLGRCPGTFRK